MFDKADILAKLQNGATADAIADEFVNALNAAEKELKELEAKRAEEEKAEEDRIYAAKREAVCEIIDGFCDFVVASGDDEMLAELQNVDVDKMVRMFDEMIEMIELSRSMARLKNLEFPKVENDEDVWGKLFAAMF